MTVSKACKMLMIKEPFYGLFLSTLNKKTSTSIPTMAVGLEGINLVLYVNEKFWESLADDQQIALLKHEMMHICFMHLTMGNHFDNKHLFNVAADLEINQLIKDLPNGALTLDTFAAMGINLPEKAGSAKYYKILSDLNMHEEIKGLSGTFGKGQSDDGGTSENNQSNNESSGTAGGNGCDRGSATGGDTGGSIVDPSKIGSHEKWVEIDDLSEAEKKLVENQIEHNLKSVAEHTIKSQGHIPNELRNIINSLFEIKPQVFNWKAYFRRLLGNSYKVIVKKSRRKLSKRFEGCAGLKIKQKARILFAIDTSGSVNEEELYEAYSELHHVYKAGVAITVLECDCSIGRIYEFSGKFSEKLTGGGGTDFAPIIEHYNENRNKYDKLILFTDGYASLTNFKAKKPVMWLISSDGDQEQNYPGITINIPKK